MAVSRPTRVRLLVLLLAAPLIALLLIPPFPLPDGYHDFADARTLLGIPNFMDVASNAMLLVAGLAGLACCARVEGSCRWAWRMFFAGVVLAAAGSAYYHWAPGVHTIAWDQLGIALACAGLFTAVTSEHLGISAQPLALPALAAIACASVALGVLLEDLRLYAWVQGATVLGVALLLVLFDGTYSHRHYLGFGLALYALAKIAEFLDASMFEWLQGRLSGHTLKHLLAAAAVGAVAAMLVRRVSCRSSPET